MWPLNKTACVRNKLPHAQLKTSFAVRITRISNDHRRSFIGVCKKMLINLSHFFVAILTTCTDDPFHYVLFIALTFVLPGPRMPSGCRWLWCRNNVDRLCSLKL